MRASRSSCEVGSFRAMRRPRSKELQGGGPHDLAGAEVAARRDHAADQRLKLRGERDVTGFAGSHGMQAGRVRCQRLAVELAFGCAKTGGRSMDRPRHKTRLDRITNILEL